MKLICLICVLLACSSLYAKPKPAVRTYPAPCSRVWDAAKAAVKSHYDVLNLNDQDKSGSFTTGSVWSGVRPIAFSLDGSGASCTVSVTGHFSGLIHNDKGSFFERVEEALEVEPAK